MTSRRRALGDDSGAALVLALGAVLLIGAVMAGLLAFITTSVRARPQLDVVRDRQYAADAGVEYAITQVRQLALPGETPCGGPYTVTLNSAPIRIDCRNSTTLVLGNGVLLKQRNVVFEACLDTGATCVADDVIVRAQVNFEAGAPATPGGAVTVTRTYVQSWSVNR